MIRPDGLRRGHFCVLDIDPKPELSFFPNERHGCLAQWGIIPNDIENEITIP